MIDLPFCEKFGVLSLYSDWADMSQWPRLSSENEIIRREQTKQQDPLTKKGVVGAFYRTYAVTQAMARFLPGVYETTDIPGRLTYAGGSTTGGAVLYGDDRYLFSHHATDPVSGMLVNAWDLVRIHKYGDQDDAVPATTPASGMPSYRAMQKLAMEDDAVRSLIAMERQDYAAEVFGGVETVQPAPAQTEEPKEVEDWLSKMRVDSNGNYEKTVNNIILILTNDPRLKGRIAIDEFNALIAVIGQLPWDHVPYDKPRRWDDNDDAGLHWYLEEAYRINAKTATEDALRLGAKLQTINSVKTYLTGLEWDGVSRLDTLFVDYLGAEDNPYTRAVARKTLCAACARAVVGGVKFDYMPIIIGRQGIGKSTLLSMLGKEWFSDSLVSFEGKDAAEMLQGTWINEIGELAAMTKYETNSVKQFLSKKTDIFRPSYGRTTQEYPRRCVFIGTSNHTDVLKDATGNRRFWPIDTEIMDKKKDVWRDLPNEVDQIWAEAYFRYQLGEPLYMDRKLEDHAQQIQRAHEEEDDWAGLIAEWLNRPIPANWETLTLSARRSFWAGAFETDEELVPRDRVCAREIYMECLNNVGQTTDSRAIKRINNIMLRMPGWAKNKSIRRFGPHGQQRGYERIFTYKGGGEWG